MRHNKTWNGLLPVVGVVALVVLSGCAKEKLEVTESGFSCSGEINSNTWKCAGTARMERNDLQQTFILVDADESVQEESLAAQAPSEEVAPIPPEPEWVKSLPEPAVRPVMDEQAVAPKAETPALKGQVLAVAEGLTPSTVNLPECPPAYSAEQFYLQFSASRTVDGLKVLAARLLPVESEIIHTMVEGDVWFVLISKGFNTRGSARFFAALLQKRGVSKPWIRPGYSLLSALAPQTPVEATRCR